MSNKQKSYLLISLIVVATIMLVYRVGHILNTMGVFENNVKIPVSEDLKDTMEDEIIIIENPTYEELIEYASPSETNLVNELMMLKDALEIKALELEKKEIELQLMSVEIENQMNVLKAAENRLLELVEMHDSQTKENTTHLIKLYSEMNTKDATRIIENLDLEVALNILKALDTDKAASIIAHMNLEKAKEITNKFFEDKN